MHIDDHFACEWAPPRCQLNHHRLQESTQLQRLRQRYLRLIHEYITQENQEHGDLKMKMEAN